MRRQKGRKAFILLTDGVSFRDKTSIGTAIEFAQRADTILYTIRFAAHNAAYRPGRALVLGIAEEHGKHALQRMAAETGGEAFEVSKDEPIEKVFSEIEELLRNQYSLGYTPDRPSQAGKFHRIRLTVKNRALIVRTRDGYYSRREPAHCGSAIRSRGAIVRRGTKVVAAICRAAENRRSWRLTRTSPPPISQNKAVDTLLGSRA